MWPELQAGSGRLCAVSTGAMAPPVRFTKLGSCSTNSWAAVLDTAHLALVLVLEALLGEVLGKGQAGKERTV